MAGYNLLKNSSKMLNSILLRPHSSLTSSLIGRNLMTTKSSILLRNQAKSAQKFEYKTIIEKNQYFFKTTFQRKCNRNNDKNMAFNKNFFYFFKTKKN